ncbi:MAG: hypothetical protein ABEH78_00100 [Haloferacaceae archaeon]
MRIEVDGRTFEFADGAVDLGTTAPPEDVVRAVRGEAVDGVVADCPAPGLLHEHVGYVHEGMATDVRGALAAAARSLGVEAPQRDDLDAVRDELASLSVPDADLDAVRRRVADAGRAEERLRERVATLRGRAEAFDEAGDGRAAAEARDALRNAVRELAEAETERIAAEQRRERLERDVREVRDRRERRFELQDCAANLERAAREYLAERVYDRFRSAVAAVPGEGTAGDGPGEYEGDPVTAALAAARVGAVDAPLVIATDRLGDARVAARRLDAPVVRL